MSNFTIKVIFDYKGYILILCRVGNIIQSKKEMTLYAKINRKCRIKSFLYERLYFREKWLWILFEKLFYLQSFNLKSYVFSLFLFKITFKLFTESIDKSWRVWETLYISNKPDIYKYASERVVTNNDKTFAMDLISPTSSKKCENFYSKSRSKYSRHSSRI